MALFRMIRSGPSLPLALVAGLLSPVVVAAQHPRVSPDARGYQATMALQQARQTQTRPTATRPEVRPQPTRTIQPAPTSGVVVAVRVPTTPAQPEPTFVTIKGPDGEVRRFPLASGSAVIKQPQVIVLRPGESTTIQIVQSAPTKK